MTAMASMKADNDVSFDPVEKLVADLRAGRMVLVMDDHSRENEADIIACADRITPDQVNFMARYGRGLVCLALTADDCDRLDLAQQPRRNRDPFGTAFTVSIDALATTTTGISAAERAATIRLAADPASKPDDFITPGHVFPIRARPGGVLERPGHTEAAVDLVRLAGASPAAAICEVMRDDGEMARAADAFDFARLHGMAVGSVADLVAYRKKAGV